MKNIYFSSSNHSSIHRNKSNNNSDPNLGTQSSCVQ